jgi:pyridoxal 5'-phosphate synthase pdxT subunit
VTRRDQLTVGVLALQGDVREHLRALTECGARARTVRRPSELDDVDALVIPGGESTTISKLAVEFGLAEPIRKRLAGGMPAYGSCAGMIMLAQEVLDGRPDQQTFATAPTRELSAEATAPTRELSAEATAPTRELSAEATAPTRELPAEAGIDMTVRRNAFGRQVESFEAPVRLAGVDGPPFHAVFIRAPWVERVGEGVTVLGRIEGGPAAGRIVAVRQGNLLATAFHPELTGDLRVHRLFVDLARGYGGAGRRTEE